MTKWIGKILKILGSRLFIVGFILLFQIVWVVSAIQRIGKYSLLVNNILTLLSILTVLWLINKKGNPAYKLAWVIPILLYPLLGGLMYLFMGDKRPSKKIRERMSSIYAIISPLVEQDSEVILEIEKTNQYVANQAKYISKTAHYPIYKNTTSEYFKSGEDIFQAIKEEIKKAKHYIFLEFFIIEEGVMWDETLSLLEKKVKEGVEVRLLYDDMGCLTTLPSNYEKKIREKGIQCISFNKFIPVFSVAMNHRDHRKIIVIDGCTAFTGGINLADEYINVKVRFGHWKDTGIMIKGEAVWNFTIMFLQMWNSVQFIDRDFTRYLPDVYHRDSFESDGFVQPYGDSPLDQETVGENVYLNVINCAREYIYIFTPYLIIDNEMMTALCLASKKGIDVRIVTPGIPDKKYVFLLTQSYYGQLLEAGVRIYEYTPGFIHAKSFVCDDEVATVGTINMDYRSLYLHFECGILLFRTKSVQQVKEDFIETMNASRQVIDTKGSLIKKLVQAVLRLFAPLM